MEIKAYIFDIDDTLVATTRSNHFARDNALASLSHYLETDVTDRLKEIEVIMFREFGWARLPDLWRAVCLEWGKQPPEEDFVKELHEKFRQDFVNSLSLFPGAMDLLKTLKGKGKHLGVISDGDSKWQWCKLRKTGLDEIFNLDYVKISIQSDLYSCKPSTANYRFLRNAFELKPEEMLYVGDKPKDVIGANVSGWFSVRTVEAFKEYPDPWPKPKLNIEKPNKEISSITQLLEL